MTQLHGFELIEERQITELNTQAKLYRHQRTGAELLSLENQDENKVFGVAFCTPPEDSTGLPHILEHAVLAGSRKYPVKEPFVELLKGSLATFVNAMTYPDLTVYPLASQNVKDFYNLIDVYLDAVFYPLMTEKVFQQEGWHYELENLDAPLTYKGVVFNEMKGAYSSPDGVLERDTQIHLLPDTPYGVDSGGDPAVIPDLTYEQFKKFHHTYYHPSNGRFFFYGDDDPAERLRLIDAFIADFDALDVNSDIPLQPRFEEPRRIIRPYGVAEGEDSADSKKGMMTVSWLLDKVTETETALALMVLNHILVETPASPLRKALIDSGLGEDLTGEGLTPYQKEMFFTTGLKGIAVDDAEKVEKLILDTLAVLANEGVEQDMIDAALNTTEFQLREANFGSLPRGLALMMVLGLHSWIHGGKVIDRLAFEAPLEKVKKAAAEQKNYFGDLIRRYFLDNTHRSTVILKPDAAFNEKLESTEKARLEKVKAALSEADLKAIMEDAAELHRMQETPDSPEALATIPMLARDDLDKENKTVPLEKSESAGSTVLYHDLFSNGIVYLDMGFNLHILPQEYLPWVQLFGRALLEMGTEKEDFVRLSRRIGSQTGGIHATPLTSPVIGEKQSAAWLFLRGKVMADRPAALFDILQDVLLTANLDNQERFRQIVLEEKSSQEAGLIPMGHRVVLARVRAHFHEAYYADEQIGGIDYLFFLRKVLEQMDSDWPGVVEKLEDMRRILLNRNAMLFNVTVDAEHYATFQPHLGDFIKGLPEAPVDIKTWNPTVYPESEGLTIPAQVNYVGKGANLYQAGYQLHGSHVAITRYLYTTWLWTNIRVQGGAYGGGLTFDHLSGVAGYYSYRDPNLLKSLDTYDKTAQFLQKLELDADELTRSIIAGIGLMDAYQLPDAKGFTSMMRHLIGYTETMRQQRREELLNTTIQDFRTFGEVLQAAIPAGQIVVLGAAAQIEKASTERDKLFQEITKVM